MTKKAPMIESVWPRDVGAHTVVRVEGANFGPNTTAWQNEHELEVEFISDTELRVRGFSVDARDSEDEASLTLRNDGAVSNPMVLYVGTPRFIWAGPLMDHYERLSGWWLVDDRPGREVFWARGTEEAIYEIRAQDRSMRILNEKSWQDIFDSTRLNDVQSVAVTPDRRIFVLNCEAYGEAFINEVTRDGLVLETIEGVFPCAATLSPGPDGRLYLATSNGRIFAFTEGSGGTWSSRRIGDLALTVRHFAVGSDGSFYLVPMSHVNYIRHYELDDGELVELDTIALPSLPTSFQAFGDAIIVGGDEPVIVEGEDVTPIVELAGKGADHLLRLVDGADDELRFAYGDEDFEGLWLREGEEVRRLAVLPSVAEHIERKGDNLVGTLADGQVFEVDLRAEITRVVGKIPTARFGSEAGQAVVYVDGDVLGRMDLDTSENEPLIDLAAWEPVEGATSLSLSQRPCGSGDGTFYFGFSALDADAQDISGIGRFVAGEEEAELAVLLDGSEAPRLVCSGSQVYFSAERKIGSVVFGGETPEVTIHFGHANDDAIDFDVNDEGWIAVTIPGHFVTISPDGKVSRVEEPIGSSLVTFLSSGWLFIHDDDGFYYLVR